MAGDATDDELHIVDDPVGRRYEARLGKRVVGYAAYRLVDHDRLILYHTEIDAAFEGQGIGSRLAAGALDDVRRRGVRLTVRCPFIAAYLRRHREYDDLLPPGA